MRSGRGSDRDGGPAFDDEGRPIPAVDFDYAAVDGAEAAEASSSGLDLVRAMDEAALTAKGTAKQRTILLIAGVALRSDRTQREIAERLRVSKPALCRAVDNLRSVLAGLDEVLAILQRTREKREQPK